MSDGITEGYRAGRAHDRYRKLIDEAIAEHVLLVEEAKAMRIDEIIIKLVELCSKMEITKYTMFKGYYKGIPTPFYTSSIMIGEKEQYTEVEIHEVSVSVGVYEKFKAETLEEALKSALIFASVCKTEEGQRAIEAHDDY